MPYVPSSMKFHRIAGIGVNYPLLSILTLVRGLLLATYVLGFHCPAVFAADREGIGLNKYDLLLQYIGKASDGDGSWRYLRVTQAMGRKAILDAGDIGIPFFRVAVTGYHPTAPDGPDHLDIWRRDSTRYWALVDHMFDDLDAAGVRFVPVFVWNSMQFPSITGETVRELITRPESKSWALLESYVRAFVERYRNRKTILFYELTNELNRGADLDTVEHCSNKRRKDLCQAKGHYTTDEMISFSKRLAQVIRSMDGTRKISSGYTVPRSSAEHLRGKPQWISGKADWTPDTQEQFEKNIRDIHDGLDIISVHLYPKASKQRFGARGTKGIGLLDASKQAADKAGKPLFVGEFGDSEDLSGSPESYPVQMMDRIVQLKIPYSAVWIWEFYQHNLHAMGGSQYTAYSLEPGRTDQFIASLRTANQKVGGAKSAATGNDTTPPRVVLTWPLECDRLLHKAFAYAVASDNSGKVEYVELWLDEAKLATVREPPYRVDMDMDNVEPGEHQLRAKAFDAAGNDAHYSTTVLVGSGQPARGRCAEQGAAESAMR